MAALAASSTQFASLCNLCECLQLNSETVHILLKNATGREEEEVDLHWKSETDELRQAFRGYDRRKCDSCRFFHGVVLWWIIRQSDENKPPMEYARVSLHYVFRLGETSEYALRALRIRARSFPREGQQEYPQEFHIDCPISSASHTNERTSLGLQPPLSHINEETIGWMNSRLESCVLHDHINPQKEFVPDRLIDVREGQLRLVSRKDLQLQDIEIPRYVALTYCWGPPPHCDQQLKTTSTNLSQHEHAIPEFSLPQTIKDAVATTRALSIPFLWVDALCILQDDVSDWVKQCAVMERIYGNAYVTVAAASSNNCEDGFIKRTNEIILPFTSHVDGPHAFAMYSPSYSANTDEDLNNCPWLMRGWTFQERIASARMLMFSASNVHFKCMSFRESMGRRPSTRDVGLRMLNREVIHSGNPGDIYEEWAATVSQVTPARHQFTRDTDLLPAIAGIAAMFQASLHDEYMVGLWKRNLHQCLCWNLSNYPSLGYQSLLQKLRKPSPYIAPSWSWASRQDWFSFPLFKRSFKANCRREFHDLTADINLRSESVFGEVESAALDITSKVYVGSHRITYHRSLHRIFTSIRSIGLDGRYLAHFSPDCKWDTLFESAEGSILTAPISLLLIGSTVRCPRKRNEYTPRDTVTLVDAPHSASSSSAYNSEDDWEAEDDSETDDDSQTEDATDRAAYGLLIHPTGNLDEYYRVGTFFSEPVSEGGLSFFTNLNLTKVKLV